MTTEKRNPYSLPSVRIGSYAELVPRLRVAVAKWRENKYEEASKTSKRLLNYWFYEDHKTASNKPFKYYFCQQEAIETLIYCYEVMKAKDLVSLLQKFGKQTRLSYEGVPPLDFPKYAFKMATGSGKTKVMSLAIVWSYFHRLYEENSDLTTNFLVLAPNVIVFERLALDFINGKIFGEDPLIPPEYRDDWNTNVILRDDTHSAIARGMIYLTNIQQLYPRDSAQPRTPIEELIGRPLTIKEDFVTSPTLKIGSLILRHKDIMILNDEAHHIHAPDLKGYEVIASIHKELVAKGGQGIRTQLDFSATPKDQKGQLFPWVLVDYPLADAIKAGIVKEPRIGIVTNAKETESKRADLKYKYWIDAAYQRWKEYWEKFQPSGRKPVLFVMADCTRAANEIANYLETLAELKDHTLIIHTNLAGEISRRDLENAREACKKVDLPENPWRAIVSVLMLREGWDVKNVTVVLGLRPYTAKPNILPEQTVGRGLRLMEGPASGVLETVDIIGNKHFLDIIDDLKKEGIEFGTVTIGEEEVTIETICVDDEKMDYDISIPQISQSYWRETESLDKLKVTEIPPPATPISLSEKPPLISYEAKDLYTYETKGKFVWTFPVPHNVEAVISHITKNLIMKEAKITGQFSKLAPIVKEYVRTVLFGQVVELDDENILLRLNNPDVYNILIKAFCTAIKDITTKTKPTQLIGNPQSFSSTLSFPWSGATVKAKKTIFNLVTCDSTLEGDFAKFLDRCSDVLAFVKNPPHSGNTFILEYINDTGALRLYYPDFIVKTKEKMYVVETKGYPDPDVEKKDARVIRWCEDATKLTRSGWEYLKVNETFFRSKKWESFDELIRAIQEAEKFQKV